MKLADETIKDHSVLGDFVDRDKKFLYRKGEIGDWKNHFTVAMNEQFDAIYKEEMKDSDIQTQFE